MGRGGRPSGRGMCGTSPHARQATGGERGPRGGAFDGREGPSCAEGCVARAAAVDEILKNLEKSRMCDIILTFPIDSGGMIMG